MVIIVVIAMRIVLHIVTAVAPLSLTVPEKNRKWCITVATYTLLDTIIL